LNCLTQEPCAPPKHAGNLGRFGIAQVKCRITEVSDWGIMGPMDGYFEITVKVVGFMQVYC